MYDKAEKNGAYIGQINMITVSSFSGPSAVVWGYDLVPPVDLRKELLFVVPDRSKKLPDPFQSKIDKLPPSLRSISVYCVDPLLRATQSLFGTDSDRNFPPLAGAHVPCAAKSSNSIDPNTGKPTSGWVWCYIALAIADNRDRDACLFVEDGEFFADTTSYGKVTAMTEEEVIKELNRKRYEVVYSQFLCGIDQHTPFKEIFVGYEYKRVDAGFYGCALTCAPYVTLAKKVYPGGDAKLLTKINLGEWEAAVGITAHKT